jgi:enoyl-CoA hydratase
MLFQVRPVLLRLPRQIRLSSSYTHILPTAPRPRVAMVELNRPKALNALSSRVMAELNSHLKDLDSDKEIGAIVLTGGEKVFAGTFPCGVR